MLPEEQINLYGYKNDLDKFYNYYNKGSLPKKFCLLVMRVLVNVHLLII